VFTATVYVLPLPRTLDIEVPSTSPVRFTEKSVVSTPVTLRENSTVNRTRDEDVGLESALVIDSTAGGSGVFVAVLVGVLVGVRVGVEVGVLVGVLLGVDVMVGVLDGVGVMVGVLDGVGVAISEMQRSSMAISLLKPEPVVPTKRTRTVLPACEERSTVASCHILP